MHGTRCFILGAGFSRCCGLPLACELTPVVWRAMARRDPTDRSPNAPLSGPGDFAHPALETDFKAIRLLFPGYVCDPDRGDTWPDFEELITALDEASGYQQSFERITGTEVHNWAAHPKHWLMHHLQERLSELTDAAAEGGLKPIMQFIQALDLLTDSVISFNWDVLVEIAAEQLGVPVHYRDDQGAGLRLAKPHGSLNLVDSPRDKYEETRERAVNVFGLDEELEYDDGGRKHVVLRAQDPRHAWIRQAWAPREFVLLVEPNIRKAYDRRWLELQWVRALDMVRHADEIIVIGFSLPPADLRPRILLQLAPVNRRPSPKLVLVDPKADALAERYRHLVGLDPEPCTETLETWVAHGR